MERNENILTQLEAMNFISGYLFAVIADEKTPKGISDDLYRNVMRLHDTRYDLSMRLLKMLEDKKAK